MSIEAMTTKRDEDQVLEILRAAGSRGASHEDFIEAGLATGYIVALRRLVDDRGLRIRTDFTTGQPRWALVEKKALAA